ncbi:MAG: sugar phosphate isomerase/epimerase [Lachnospiraceae bacterium]|nr:sugar phosphate isomerase/epimerase [Lachnospiraceae bacterium]
MEFKLAAFADEASPALTGQIKALKDNGIPMLEIRNFDGKNIAEITKKEAKEVRKRLEDEGLSVWSIGSPYGKINVTDDFKDQLEKFKRSIDICFELNTKHIRLFSFYESQDRFDEVADRLDMFIEAAKGSDVVLCHENEKGIYGDIASRCLKIHETFPQIRAIFDPANFVQSGQDTKEAWEMLSPYVEYMHIKDALPDGSVVPAGKGVGQLKYLLSQYKGHVLTIEPHLAVFDGLNALEGKEKSKVGIYEYPDSETAFKAAADALKEIIYK